jgi:DNA-binding CsgD family transcriptional regulator/PAS domain-containing protein
MTPALHHLIDGIYEAPRSPAGWRATLDLLRRHLNARSALLFYRHHRLRQASLVAHAGLEEGQLAACGEVLWQEETQQRGTGELQPVAAPSPAASRCYRALGAAHVARGWLFDEPEHSALLELYRDEGSPPFEAGALASVSALSEHFERALRIHAAEARERQQYITLAGGVNTLALGVVLFDETSAVVYHNESAARLLQRHPALELRRQRLSATEPRQAERLRQAIAEAADSRGELRQERAAALSLGHEERGGTVHAWVMPLGNGRSPRGEGIERAVAALLLGDSAMSLPLQAEPLIALYGLSPKEAEVALGIAMGRSVEAIAEQHCRSLSTVRSQLKAVYRKTGTQRQAQLIRQLLDGSHLLAPLSTIVAGELEGG